MNNDNSNSQDWKLWEHIDRLEINLTDEQAAKLWAMIEGLEIVSRGDKE